MCMLQWFTIFFQKWTTCPLHCAIYYWICIKLTYICILRLSIIQSSVIITTFYKYFRTCIITFTITVLPYRPFVLYVMTPKNYIVVYTHSLSLIRSMLLAGGFHRVEIAEHLRWVDWNKIIACGFYFAIEIKHKIYVVCTYIVLPV